MVLKRVTFEIQYLIVIKGSQPGLQIRHYMRVNKVNKATTSTQLASAKYYAIQH